MSTNITPGSTILVTGGAGYLGSAIVNQLAAQGFKVRATTRTASKLDKLEKKIEQHFGPGTLEVVEIKNLFQKGALDGALDGVAGVINVATDSTFSNNISEIVSNTVTMTKEVVKSVQRAGGVKSFVLTSSRVAAFGVNGTHQEIDDTNWFDEAATLAEQAPEGGMKGALAYAASKVAGERALWKWVETEKPEFRVNTVLPDQIFGKIHNPEPANYSSGSALQAFANGEPGLLDVFLMASSWFVNVDDTAKLHIAALLDESVNGQRLWAATGPFSAIDIQEALKEVKPDYTEKDISSFPPRADVTIDNSKSIKLLEKHYGHGFTDFKTTVEANL